jgi:hypothetical protein
MAVTPVVAASLVAEVADRLHRSLMALEQAYEAAGRSLADLGPADALAERMLAVVPRPAVGSDGATERYFGVAKVAALLGLTPAEVEARRAERQLLGLRSHTGVVVYPTAQFTPEGGVPPGLADVLARFPAGDAADRRLASWLRRPQPSLEGLSVLSWLRAGLAVSAVLDLTTIDLTAIELTG